MSNKDSTDSPNSIDLYGGISGCELNVESFELGEGVVLSKTFAHLTAPFIMAFAPPGPEGHHPGPWSAAEGGFGFDIHVEIHVPASFHKPDWLDREDTIWWIAALLRLARVPFITVPVISDASFASVPKLIHQPHLRPMEVTSRIFGAGNDSNRILREDDLVWIREHWIEGGYLMKKNDKLNTAFRAFDSAAVRGKPGLSLISLWGGLEQLFLSSSAELRFRVSALIASYLSPIGPERLSLFKRILKLYDARSTAAHTANDIEMGQLVETYVMMRNALVKIIDENHVPSREELEAMLFGVA
jgi:hypothetical protein